MLRLRFRVEGEERVQPLTATRLRVGRGGDNDLVLADVSVSRNHAELRRDAGGWGGWTVVDLGSTNGVELNRVPVQAAPLHPGDRLGIGCFELLLEEVEPAIEPAERTARPGPAPATASAEGLAGIAKATIVRPLADFTADYGLELGAARAAPSAATAPGEDYGRRMLGFLTRLGRELISAESTDEVLCRVFDVAWEALPVDRGFILLSTEAGELACELARFEERVELRPRGEVPVSRTMLEAVMSERVALVTYDALADRRLAGGESIRLHQIRAAMCAPLWSGDSIIGVVQVDSPFKVGAFTERDLDFLTALANSAAVAVERLRYAERAAFERQVRGRLERYHSPAMIEDLLRADAGPDRRRARAAEASVLFADLSGFTAFAEGSRPEAVADLLDAFLSLAVDAIFAAEGTLDKFIGDCVMAFFGAPVPQPDHALRAVTAAVEIQRALAAWNERRAAQGLPPFHARIGVNSGPVVVGDIGSSRRIDYTVLGNTVNVAARLEAHVARPGDVVIGPETHRLLAGALATEPLGELQLKGMQQRIEAWRVMA